MKYDELNLQKIREVPIFDVCSKLGISLYGMGQITKRATCWYHDDKHPSMHVNKNKNIYKCFVCGNGGDVIKLVQDYENLSFTEACEWIINECNIIVTDEPRKQGNKEIRKQESVNPKITSSLCPLPSDIVTKHLSLNSVFCRAVVSQGYLSDAQLRHAADRYHLGCSDDGGVIFWEIDNQQRVHTGKIMYYHSDCHRDKQHTPTWVHSLMKDKLPQNYELQHCLFGLHLLTSDLSHQTSTICIVESEKTAVILSEIFPDFLWLSCGGLQMFKPELLAPLVNHKVVLFPDTDETGEAYNQWLSILQQAQKLNSFRYPIRISRILEDHATPDQKQRKIDIVDFLFDN